MWGTPHATAAATTVIQAAAIHQIRLKPRILAVPPLPFVSVILLTVFIYTTISSHEFQGFSDRAARHESRGGG